MRKKTTTHSPARRGEQPYVPTPEFKALVSCGVLARRTPQQIADVLGISLPTLKKHYAHELDTAVSTLLMKSVAVVAGRVNAKDFQAAMEVLRRVGGWNETMEHKGKLVHEHEERAASALARLGELAKAGDHESAAQVYEEMMRPPPGKATN